MMDHRIDRTARLYIGSMDCMAEEEAGTATNAKELDEQLTMKELIDPFTGEQVTKNKK